MIGFPDAEPLVPQGSARRGLIGGEVRRRHRRTVSYAIALVLACAGAVLCLRTFHSQQAQEQQQIGAAQLRLNADYNTGLSQNSNDGDGSDASGSDASADCASEFGQCAGKKDGHSFTSCCTDGTWCARFGDWWGVCLPQRLYPHMEDDHHNDGRHDHRNGNRE